MAKKGAKGGGTIRKKTVTRGGKEYTYWEARVTTGRDPGTGKQIQRSFTGKTQKEVREKMQAAAVEVNQGTYTAPQRMTVGQWLDVWASDYLGGVKPATVMIYRGNIKNHIRPALGAVRLDQLHPHMVQGFVNGLELSPASVRLAYKVLHIALEKAVELDYIPRNPAARCELPRLEQKEIHPLDDQQVAALLAAAKGGRSGILGHCGLVYRASPVRTAGPHLGRGGLPARHYPRQQAAGPIGVPGGGAVHLPQKRKSADDHRRAVGNGRIEAPAGTPSGNAASSGPHVEQSPRVGLYL